MLGSVLITKTTEWRQTFETHYGIPSRFRVADPQFHVEDIECRGSWPNPVGRTPEQRAKQPRSYISKALIMLLDAVQRSRPRIIIGEGQGGVVTTMSTFPIILERACRDRAVTQHHMLTFRQAWSVVTSVLVVDPVILPTANNRKAAPIEQLDKVFPDMNWNQPRNNRRAVLIMPKDLTSQFAESLSELMGCSAERTLPARDFIEDALCPPPIYFETDEPTFQGVCCVCCKNGCLGRYLNPGCGLLMHHSCVEPSRPGVPLSCPVCKVEVNLQNQGSELPSWHEAEVGGPMRGKKKTKRLPPDTESMPFPLDRMPSKMEAQIVGFKDR